MRNKIRKQKKTKIQTKTKQKNKKNKFIIKKQKQKQEKSKEKFINVRKYLEFFKINSQHIVSNYSFKFSK